ncbi:hypothetical protein KIW84_065327 [Lathyrus oleraceus]|uniref:Uncharacterized protein n=1 Tax=Pisum sativum TaxID=3888 RepID=A0A9D4WEB5_PEA|nr:hypothetical protein KIW84_065327 [Pisum sativum]
MLGFIESPNFKDFEDDVASFTSTKCLRIREDHLREEEKEHLKEVYVRLWEAFKDPNLDKHNNNSDSDDDNEDCTIDEFYWENKSDLAKISKEYAEVDIAKRNKKIVKKEKFIGSGWYEYVKNKRLRRGYKLGFNIGNPLDKLYVSLLKLMRKVGERVEELETYEWWFGEEMLGFIESPNFEDFKDDVASFTSTKCLRIREENLGEEEKEDLEEVHVRLWEAFKDPILNKHNSNSDSDDDNEDYTIDEFYWVKEIIFGYKSRKNVLVHCANRNKNIVKKERFIGIGWYEYAKNKRLRRGDKLGFSNGNPLDKLDPNQDKHNNNSDSNDDNEDYTTYELYWEKEIIFGYKARKNVLNFPREVTKKCLYWNQNAIKFIGDDTRKSYYGEVHCAKRNINIVKKEKFIGSGWYEYMKKKRLRREDKLGFTIHNPLDKLYVSLLKSMRKVGERVEEFDTYEWWFGVCYCWAWDPNQDKDNNNSNDDNEDYTIYELYWEREIIFGYKARKNVLNLPREVTKKCMYWNQNAIKFIDDHTGYSYYGEVHCAKRNKKIVKKEKFIGSGWYEYVKNKRLRRGDKLGFSIGNPLDKLYVSLLKSMRKGGERFEELDTYEWWFGICYCWPCYETVLMVL